MFEDIKYDIYLELFLIAVVAVYFALVRPRVRSRPRYEIENFHIRTESNKELIDLFLTSRCDDPVMILEMGYTVRGSDENIVWYRNPDRRDSEILPPRETKCYRCALQEQHRLLAGEPKQVEYVYIRDSRDIVMKLYAQKVRDRLGL
jgi:hypothetical protein